MTFLCSTLMIAIGIRESLIKEMDRQMATNI